MCDSGSFQLCNVYDDVATEFSSAGVQRYAELTHKLVAESLRGGRRPKDSKMAADLLAFLLTGDLGQNPVDTLKGLPLAPLCDGSVANLCDEKKSLCCAFPGGQQSEEIAANAHFVLQTLCASYAIDLVQVGQAGTALLRRCAEPLQILDVNNCERLAQALQDAGSNLCARAKKDSAVSKMAAAASTFVGNLLGSGGNYSESLSSNALGLGNTQQANAIISSLWNFALQTPEGLGDEFLESFADFLIMPAAEVKQTAQQHANGNATSSSDAVSEVAAPPVATPLRTLELLPLSVEHPLLLPLAAGAASQLEQLFDVASCILADRFVDTAHPVMTPQVVSFLVGRAAAKPFSGASVLSVLAASTGTSADVSKASFKAVASRCSKLRPTQRDCLCVELANAFCALSAATPDRADDDEEEESSPRLQSEMAAIFGLPIFLEKLACLHAVEVIRLHQR
jgi:hypothetical protein